MVRLAHFSDIHITSTKLDWRLKDFFNKRLTSWFNYQCLGRKRRFRNADKILRRLVDELQTRHIDHIVFSGDATALGFESEFRRAADLLRVPELAVRGMAVPGNHDYLNKFAERSGLFEKYFEPWQRGQRIGGHTYPFAQKVGPVWLVGVNASTANFLPWDASGAVGADQLQRLQQLLARLDDGIRILVIHYPIRLRSERREIKFRNLRDLDRVVAEAERGGVSLWLHGHRHHPYFFQRLDDTSFPVICSGAATQNKIWAYNEYSIDGNQLTALRRVFDPEQQRFLDEQEFQLTLRTPEAIAT